MIALDADTIKVLSKQFNIARKDDSELISKQSLATLTDSLTNIQNAFNQIKTYGSNVALLEKTVLTNSQRDINQNTDALNTLLPSQSSTFSISSDITTSILKLTKGLKELTLNDPQESVLCSCENIIGDDIDIDRSKKRSRGSMRGIMGVGAAALGTAALGYGAYEAFSANTTTKAPTGLKEKQTQASKKSESMLQKAISGLTSFTPFGLSMGLAAAAINSDATESILDFIKSGFSKVSSFLGFGGSGYEGGGGGFGGGGADYDYGSTENIGVLDAIAKAEGTYTKGYNVSLGYGAFLPGGKEQDLTNMTLSQMIVLGNYMRKQPKNPNSSALGRYQIVNTTMIDAAKDLKMDLNTTKFDATTQDRMAMWIVKKQGLGAWEGFKRHPELRAAAENALRNPPSQQNGSATAGRPEMHLTGLSAMKREQSGKYVRQLGITGTNGNLPNGQLKRVGNTNQLAYPAAADAFVALKAAADRAGIPIGLTEAYRSYSEQVRMKKTKGRMAATPGYSMHGWGLAFDISGLRNPKTMQWMKANAPRFGIFGPLTNPKEHWHWEYRGGGSTNPPTTPVKQATQTPAPKMKNAGGNITVQAIKQTKDKNGNITQQVIVLNRPKSSTSNYVAPKNKAAAPNKSAKASRDTMRYYLTAGK